MLVTAFCMVVYSKWPLPEKKPTKVLKNPMEVKVAVLVIFLECPADQRILWNYTGQVDLTSFSSELF